WTAGCGLRATRVEAGPCSGRVSSPGGAPETNQTCSSKTPERIENAYWAGRSANDHKSPPETPFLAPSQALLVEKQANRCEPTYSAAPPPPGNSTLNPKVFRCYDKQPHAVLRSGAGRFGAAQFAPAPPLLVPIERRRHTQELA